VRFPAFSLRAATVSERFRLRIPDADWDGGKRNRSLTVAARRLAEELIITRCGIGI
jgi:hypothetical protein